MVRRFLYTLLLLVVGCKTPIAKDLKRLNDDVQMRTSPDMYVRYGGKNAQTVIPEDNTLELSRHEAIQFALEYNTMLKQQLENIGIAKAELEQAGLLSNPEAGTAIRSNNSKHHNVEFDASLRLSDVWQLPFRQNSAKAFFNVVLFTTISRVLDTIHEVKHAYAVVNYAELRFAKVSEIADEAYRLYRRIKKRFEHGYTNELDIALTEAFYHKWETERRRAQVAIEDAYVALRSVLGVSHTVKLKLTDDFSVSVEELPDMEGLIDHALVRRPEIEAARARVDQYYEHIRFEKSRVIDNVRFGVSLEHELDGKTIVGPLINLEIPFFDPNHAQIAKAEYLHEQAQWEVIDYQTLIPEEVVRSYKQLEGVRDNINRYTKELLPVVKKGLSYADHYTKQMRLPLPTMINAQIFLYEAQLSQLDFIRDAWLRIADLERSVGRELPYIYD